MAESDPTFVLVTGAGATSFLWMRLVQELALRGQRALPVELPGHGLDTVFPDGYATGEDFAGAPSPLAGLSLDDYADCAVDLVRRAAETGPVVLVGHSLGGSTITRVANTVPDLLRRLVYLSAYCCVNSPSVLAYAPAQPAPDSPLGRAREIAFIGDPARIGAARTNPRTGDAEVLAVQHSLLMSDLDAEHVPAVLAYATQPDEPVQALAGNAQADPDTWGRVPRSYIRTSQDQAIPLDVQDRMITEADQLTPTNPFTVDTVEASHLAPITRAPEIADILAGFSSSMIRCG